MATFVTFERYDESGPIAVNPEHVIRCTPYQDDGTRLFFSDNNMVSVKGLMPYIIGELDNDD